MVMQQANTVVEKSFWTPYAYVLYYKLHKKSLKVQSVLVQSPTFFHDCKYLYLKLGKLSLLILFLPTSNDPKLSFFTLTHEY